MANALLCHPSVDCFVFSICFELFGWSAAARFRVRSLTCRFGGSPFPARQFAISFRGVSSVAEMARFQAAGIDTRSYLAIQTDKLDGSTYLPGDFRYLHSAYPSIQDNGDGNPRAGETARQLLSHSPEHNFRSKSVALKEQFSAASSEMFNCQAMASCYI
jgi:hypothetical protein